MAQDTGHKAFDKPTVNDIARVAGVSLATVDRVLNGREGVRGVTVERVNRAIKKLGYVRDTAAASLARRRFYRLLFVMPDTDNEFVVALERDFRQQRENLHHQRIGMTMQTTPPFDANAVVRVLDAADAEETDGIALFAPETPAVRDAVARAKARGIAIVSLVSDLPESGRDFFVGIDNVAAGRTAAELMGRFIHGPGKVLVVTGSRFARDHLERRAGFDEVLGRDFPHLAAVASIEGRDDPALVRSFLPAVFASDPEIRGIYSSAAGNPGLITFLEETGRARDLTVIAHELTPASRAALEKGTFDAIISQDTGHLVRSATRLLKSMVDQTPVDETQERIRIDIYLRENIPPKLNQTGEDRE